jgi:immunoglobulin-binding protein 1
MESESRSLRAAFSEAEAQRKAIESSLATTGSSFQDNLLATIKTYEECLRITNQVSLFSPNETLEDINSSDLQYLLINFYLADLVLKRTGGDRKAILIQARDHYERFLQLLDSYDMLSRADAKLFEKFTESPNTFSIASTTDAAARRGTKIARFKEQKELKQKFEVQTTLCEVFTCHSPHSVVSPKESHSP